MRLRARARAVQEALTATPKTIQIFLPGGDPRGIRVAEITTIVQVIEVPRASFTVRSESLSY